MRIFRGAGRVILWPALFVFQAALASPSLLSYATYLGGPSATAVAVDSSGNAYVGVTGSVVKLNSSGTQILTTYNLPDIAVSSLALDSAGNVIAGGGSLLGGAALAKFTPAGLTVFSIAPVGLNTIATLALDSTGAIYVTGPSLAKTGFSNTTVQKFSPAGARVYTLTFGGTGKDNPRAIAVDASGAAWVAGDTSSTDFPVTPGAAQPMLAGGASEPGYGTFGDAFLAKVDPSGANLLYCTYWGGSAPDIAFAIVVDSTGNVYIAGGTTSANFPTIAGAFQTTYAGPTADPTAPTAAGDAFISKFSASGVPLWSTYWGGASADVAYAVALDASNNVYFAGTTESFSDFPRTGPGVATCRQTGGPFVSALDPSGAKLIHSSGMAGLGYDNVYALALDSTGAVYLAGGATSQVFFATPGAVQTAFNSSFSTDSFAARIDFTQSGTYAACVLNGASFAAGNTTFIPLGTVAPGEIVSVFGSALGPATPQGLQLTGAGAVSTSVAGVTVAFDGLPAPLLYVSATQINAVVPYGLTAAATQMTVAYNGQSYGPIPLPVAAAVPGIFTAPPGTGHGQAAALNQDGTLNSIANPAARGSVITFFAEGAGIMSPPVADGSVTGVANLPIPALPVTVSIRGVDATVSYAGAAPTYVSGLVQVNVVVPTSIDFGNLVPLMFNVGSFSSQLDITIALK